MKITQTLKILTLATFFICTAGLNSLALAQEKPGGFGLGIILGSPTAITGKYWLSRDTAFDMGLAFSYDDSVLFYGDYLVHYPGALGNHNQFVAQLSPYFGVGGIIVITNKDRSTEDRYLGKRSGSVGAGLRIPLGIEWNPRIHSIGVFIELVPGISVVPKTSGLIEGGIGIRYYF